MANATARHDAHRPSAIIPEDYEYVAQECIRIEGLGDCQFIMAERERLRKHMARTGGTYSGHQHGGNCMVCGSVNAVYTVLFHHAKTNSYVRMGQDCAMKCECGDPADFRAFREGVKDARALRAGKAKAKALLADRGLQRAWEIYEEGSSKASEAGGSRSVLFDIVGKLVKYGSLSDKQYAFLGKLVYQIDNRAEILRKRAEEDAKALPCPTGRLEIEGTVLSLKEQASDFAPGGFQLKMLVKHDTGWKVWGSVPGILQEEIQRGDRVRFSATVTPSDKDNKFGFYKRPTKAEVVS